MSAAVRFDLAEDVALQLPVEVLTEFIGVPQPERGALRAWCRQIVNLGDPEYHRGGADPGAALEKVFGYLLSLAQHRAADPADDLFSVLLTAWFAGERLSPSEVAHFATTVLNAGIETTYCSIAAGVRC